MSSRLGEIRLGDCNILGYSVSESAAKTLDKYESLNNWNDSANTGFPTTNPLFTDDINNLTDGVNIWLGYYLSDTDDLNNLNDGVIAIQGIPIVTSDTVNNWLDSLYYVYGIWWVVLSVNVADDIGAKGPGNKNKYGWKDALQYSFVAADIIGLYLAIDDLEELFQDDINILLAQWIGAETVAIGDQMWDSMMYGLADDMEVRAIVPRSFSDNMVLGDSVALNMPTVGLPNDSLSLSDVISLILNIGLSEGDDIANMNDTAGSNFPDITSKTASDTFSMSDAVLTPVLNTPATSYLRRYLNDVKD